LGSSPAWQKVMATVRAAAPTPATVLLLGESGTGKELLARLVHRLSDRAQGPYVRVNCAAVPLEMWESEFFGHRKGAFTGAAAARAPGGHPHAGGRLHRRDRRAAGPPRPADGCRIPGGAAGLPLARQRAGAAQRPGAGGDPQPRPGAYFARSPAGPGDGSNSR